MRFPCYGSYNLAAQVAISHVSWKTMTSSVARATASLFSQGFIVKAFRSDAIVRLGAGFFFVRFFRIHPGIVSLEKAFNRTTSGSPLMKASDSHG
jgi:hypothetical protein